MNLQANLVKWATGKVILLFLLLFILNNALILPWAAERIAAGSGGEQPIDLLFSYTPELVFSMVEAYGGEVRIFYALVELTVDVLYPIVYSLLFALIITALFTRLFSPDSSLQWLNRVPFLTAFIDLLENTGIVIMLLSYPSQWVAVARITSLFTTLKWLLFGFIVLLVVVGFVAFLLRRYAHKSS